MTQPPFPGNDFFDQIDSVARNLTGNAFRLKRDDPDAPQKFTEFVAQSEQEFSAIQPTPQVAQPTQSFRDFEQGGFQQPTELEMLTAAAEARIADQREQEPTFATRPDAPGPVALAGQVVAAPAELAFANFADITGLAPEEFKQAVEAERAASESVQATNPFTRFLQQVETELFAPATALRQTRGDFPQIGVNLPGEGADFHLGTAELGEVVLDPLNFIGPGRIALEGAGAAAARGARSAGREVAGAIPAVRRELDRLGNPPRVSLEDVADASTLPPRRPRTPEVREGLIEYTRDEFIPIDDPRVAPGGSMINDIISDPSRAGQKFRYDTLSGGVRQGVIGADGTIIPLPNRYSGAIPNWWTLDENRQISRGKRALVDRIGLEVRKHTPSRPDFFGESRIGGAGIPPDVGEVAEIFIRSLPDETLDDLGSSYFSTRAFDFGDAQASAGFYDTDQGLINIALGALDDGIQPERIIPHEVVHHLKQFITDDEYKQFVDLFKRDLASGGDDMLRRADEIIAETGLNVKPRRPATAEEVQLVADAYRFRSFDEFFAEVLTDKVLRDIYERSLRNPERAVFHKILDKVKDFGVALYNVFTRRGQPDIAERVYQRFVLGNIDVSKRQEFTEGILRQGADIPEDAAPVARGAGLEEGVAGFMADLEQFPRNPLSKTGFVVNDDVAVDISARFDRATNSRRIVIDEIRAFESGKGTGSDALKKITELADKHGVTLELHAFPISQRSIGVGGDVILKPVSLRRFYEKHGFIFEGDPTQLDPDVEFLFGIRDKVSALSREIDPKTEDLLTANNLYARLGTDGAKLRRIVESRIGRADPKPEFADEISEIVDSEVRGAASRGQDGIRQPQAAPAAPAAARAAVPEGAAPTAARLTPEQQAIIDDVGTGARPADDVAVDAIDAAPDVAVGGGRRVETEIPGMQELRDRKIVTPKTENAQKVVARQVHIANEIPIDEDLVQASAQRATENQAKAVSAVDKIEEFLSVADAAVKESAEETARLRSQGVAIGRKRAKGILDPARAFRAFRSGQAGQKRSRQIFEPIIDPETKIYGGIPEDAGDLLPTEAARLIGVTSEDLASLYRAIAAKWPIDSNLSWKNGQAQEGLTKVLLGDVPQPAELKALREVFGDGWIKQLLKRKPGRYKDIAYDLTFLLAKTLRSSFDYSAMLRQLVVYTINPRRVKQTAPSLKRMFWVGFTKGDPEKLAKQLNDELIDPTKNKHASRLLDPQATNKIQLHDVSGAGSIQFSDKEEIYASNIAAMLPGLGKDVQKIFGRQVPKPIRHGISATLFPIRVVGKGIRRSELMYATAINQTRMRVAGATLDNWDEVTKITGVPVQQGSIDELIHGVNVVTGRGDLPGFLSGQQGSKWLAAIFWAPKLAVSRFQAPLIGARGLVEAGVSGVAKVTRADPNSLLSRVGNSPGARARKEVAKDLVTYVATGMTVLAALEKFGIAEVETDCRSSDFGKGKIGSIRIDFWGGFQQPARYTCQAMSGVQKRLSGENKGELVRLGAFNATVDEEAARSKRTGKPTPPPDRLDLLWRFVQSKISPGLPAVTVNEMRGQTFLGDALNEPAPLFGQDTGPSMTVREREAIHQVLPLFGIDIIEAIEEAGLWVGGLLGFGAGGGVGVQTFGEEGTGRFDDATENRLGGPVPFK